MLSVKVSPKFQVVIPLEVREALQIKPGETVFVLQYDNRIEFIPRKKLKDMRGFLKGMDTAVDRDEDRV